MKKFLSFILILAMILSVSGVALAAEACTDTGCSTTHVAAIGTAQYHSLQDAIDAAKDGETVTLLADCNVDVTVTQKENVKITIDGNGKTMTGIITVDGKSATIMSAGVTIKNFKFDGTNIGADACIRMGDGTNATRYVCNLTVEDCTFTESSEAKTKVAIKTYTGGDKNLTVKNCEATGLHSLMQLKNVAGVTIEGCKVTNSGRGIALGNSTNATIDNCKISVDSYGIRGDASSDNGGMTISKTEITAEQPIVVRQANGTNGYSVTVGEGNTMTPSGENKWYTIYSANDDPDKKVSNVPTNITVPAATSAVAKIVDKLYDSLAAAVAAAKDGDTITLLDDCSGNGIVFPQDKFGATGLTIDFAGHTYTVDAAPLAGSSGTETQAFQILKGNKITLKGGELTSSKAKMLIQNYSDLNLEGMVLDGEKLDDSAGGKYVLSNNSGTVSIKDTTIKAASDGVAFDVYDYSSAGYSVPKVTVSGDSNIDGKIEKSEAATLEIESGTFSEDPSAYLAADCVVSKNANGKYVTTGAIPAAKDNDDGNAKATSNEVKIVKITKELVDDLADGKSLIVTADGMTFTFSKALLKGLLSDGGSYVAIKIMKIDQDDLNAAQHKAIESTFAKLVFTAEIYVNGEYVGDKLNGKTVAVLIPAAAAGLSSSGLDGYSLVYISDEGKLKIIASAKAGADVIEAELPHFSEYAVIKTTEANKIIASQNAPAPKPTVKPTEKPASSGIKVEYEGGNSFSTSKSAVPTSVEIDGVPVSFIGDGKYFTVGCIDPDAQWVTVRWNSTSVTTNFTPDVTVACPSLGIPKTGDMPVWAAIAAFFGF